MNVNEKFSYRNLFERQRKSLTNGLLSNLNMFGILICFNYLLLTKLFINFYYLYLDDRLFVIPELQLVLLISLNEEINSLYKNK